MKLCKLSGLSVFLITIFEDFYFIFKRNNICSYFVIFNLPFTCSTPGIPGKTKFYLFIWLKIISQIKSFTPDITDIVFVLRITIFIIIKEMLRLGIVLVVDGLKIIGAEHGFCQNQFLEKLRLIELINIFPVWLLTGDLHCYLTYYN